MKDQLIRPYAQKTYEYRVANDINGHSDTDWEIAAEYILGKWKSFMPFDTYVKMAFENKLAQPCRMPRGGGY